MCVAILLGLGALAGGWASYQSSQWGGTATENYGKAATTATRASTAYNEGIAIAHRDAALDIQAKQLIVTALTATDDLAKQRDLAVAKYLYTQQMTETGYRALGFPPAYHTKDRDTYLKFSDDDVAKGLEAELPKSYYTKVLANANGLFAEADKVFAEGQQASGTSTQHGLTSMFFTMALLLGGLALVLKNRLRWIFVFGGYCTLTMGLVKLLSLPWYSA